MTGVPAFCQAPKNLLPERDRQAALRNRYNPKQKGEFLLNYTENYQLPQWVASDRVLMADFNDAMSKTDQALLGLEEKSLFTKLKEVTVPAQSEDVTLDISGIDWGAYRYVLLDAALNGYGDCELRLNGSTQYSYVRLSDSSGSGSGFALMFMPGHLWCRFFVGKDASLPAQSVSMGKYLCYSNEGPAYQDIATLQLVVSYDRYYISAGSKLTFWGMK